MQKPLPQAHAFIDEVVGGKGAVLIHCKAGVSRSVAVAASHLMRARGMRALEAISFIKTKRPHAQPITHFVEQLLVYEETLRSQAP